MSDFPPKKDEFMLVPFLRCDFVKNISEVNRDISKSSYNISNLVLITKSNLVRSSTIDNTL
tara:strand:+ start:1459 stop:1641 length:183 start_codon:yes stop_codon:yes gene_type:complete